MPIFEYQCQDCNDTFEIFVRSAADGEHIVCPSCTSETVTKKFSAFATAVADSSSSSFTPAAARSCGPGCGCH